MKLKPCPFCGSSNVEAVHDVHVYDGCEIATIWCYGCGKYFQEFGEGKTEEEAIRNAAKAWNQRANECNKNELLLLSEKMSRIHKKEPGRLIDKDWLLIYSEFIKECLGVDE